MPPGSTNFNVRTSSSVDEKEFINSVMEEPLSRHDRIVPSFTETGKLIDPNKKVTPIMTKLNERGQVIEEPAKKTKKVKGKVKEVETYVEEPSYEEPSHTVVFETSTGKIRCDVNAVLDSDSFIGLVFSDQSAIHFEPAVGTVFKLYLDNDKVPMELLSSGCVFSWYKSDQKIMILVKHTSK